MWQEHQSRLHAPIPAHVNLEIVFDLLAQYTYDLPKPQFLFPFCDLQTSTFPCPLLKTCCYLSPLVPESPAPMQSLCPSAPAPPAPLFLLPTAQFLSCVSLPTTDPSPPIFCPAFIRLCTLPLLSQRSHGAAHLSASPPDIQCGQRPGTGGFGGDFGGSTRSPLQLKLLSPLTFLLCCVL